MDLGADRLALTREEEAVAEQRLSRKLSVPPLFSSSFPQTSSGTKVKLTAANGA